MGGGESKYRITRTDQTTSPWIGLCVVVTINETGRELKMPNGDIHKFIFINNKGLRILHGEHKGYYDCKVIY